jgi:hypothetical protein
MADAEAPAIGHNKPPLNEEIAARQETLFKRVKELSESCGRVPPLITDEETAIKVQDLIRMAKTALRSAETARTEEKAPHLANTRIVDATFKGRTDPLTNALTIVERRYTDFLKAKAAAAAEALKQEALRAETDETAAKIEKKADDKTALSQTRSELGTVGSLAKRWTFEVTDRSKIPLAVLAEYLDDEAIRLAVGRFMRNGGRELPGVRFYQEESARVV